jgi:hypothetical protein
MNRERFVKPKIDKYIQLYSKKAKADESIQTIKLTNNLNIDEAGFKYPSNQTAIISSPQSGTQPTIALTITNGSITNAVISNYANAVYSVSSPPVLTLAALPLNSTSVRSIEIVDAGDNYISAPTLKISYPPTARKAILTGTLVNGSLSSITIVDGGAGYVSAPSVVVQGSPVDADDVPAVVSLTITSGVITGYTITSGGNYDATSCIIFVGEPNTTDIATANCTINAEGKINSVTITNIGLNYTSPPTIQISGLGSAVLRTYLTEGFGANIVLDTDYVPTTIYKYTWELESPIEINENALLQVVHREFFNVPTNDKNKLIVMRLHDISSKSVVNTKNTSENADFNGGVVVDIGLENRLLPNEIILEINPQTIDRITLSLNHDISGTAGFHSQIEFLVLLKVVEKEPTIIEYGTLNNLNFLQ